MEVLVEKSKISSYKEKGYILTEWFGDMLNHPIAKESIASGKYDVMDLEPIMSVENDGGEMAQKYFKI